MGWLWKFKFFFLQWANHKIKTQTMEAPKNRRFYLVYVEAPFSPPIYLKGQHLPKAYGIKWGAIGNKLQEHIENLMGTLWGPQKTPKERIWRHFDACCAFSLVACNFYFQSYWSPFSTLANTLAKNCGILNPNAPSTIPPRRTLHFMRQLLIGCMQIGCQYFWPGLIALPKNTLSIWFDFWLQPLF
jgi:hypothetical protein